ncbi:hypothetical protein B9Z55_008897 [Caenorhabditis nigoni]|uniref:Uncharacterized protein n=1 Tax=Caenorhabditis nigoni TaxID=1611254 RepID=A0A2G5UPR9_9PELO|nr:hypothetical protein B9Z55_008897 [Caenorhabditis nigoni]
MMTTIGRFVGGVGEMIFLSLAGDTEELGILFFAGQRFFHVKHWSNHFFMEVASTGSLRLWSVFVIDARDVVPDMKGDDVLEIWNFLEKKLYDSNSR